MSINIAFLGYTILVFQLDQNGLVLVLPLGVAFLLTRSLGAIGFVNTNHRLDMSIEMAARFWGDTEKDSS